MKLPSPFSHSKEWTLVGPMGPEIPEAFLAYSILSVDGGARFSSRMDIWVGDSDSYSGTPACEHIFSFPPQKSTSDLALALSLFSENGPYTLHCWGFMGGRKDHELFNLGEAVRFLEKSPGSKVIFYEENGKNIFNLYGQGEWNLNFEGVFSLASVRDVRIKLTGLCAYPIPEPTLMGPLSSFGLSNIASGEIRLKNDGPVILMLMESP